MRPFYHRNGKAWTHEEDLKLIKLMGSDSNRDGRRHFRVADAMHRSPCALEARWYTLRSVLSRPSSEVTELRLAVSQTLVRLAKLKLEAAKDRLDEALEVDDDQRV